MPPAPLGIIKGESQNLSPSDVVNKLISNSIRLTYKCRTFLGLKNSFPYKYLHTSVIDRVNDLFSDNMNNSQLN